MQKYEEPESPKEAGMFEIYDEPSSPNQRASSRYVMNRYCQMRGVFNMCDEPVSPNEGACLRHVMKRYVMNRNRQIRGHV